MRSLVFSAALPPPVHGQSTISLRVLERLKELPFERYCCVNTSPHSLVRGWRYHFRRLLMVLLTLVRILQYRFISRDLVLYTVYEAGFGVFYNFLVCGIARLLNYKIFLHHHTSRHVKLFTRKFKFLDVILGSSVTHIVLSEHMRSDLISMYKPVAEVIALPNLAILNDMNAIENFDCKSKLPGLTLGLLSNLTIEKGALCSLDICRDLLRKGMPVKLVLAGGVFDPVVKSAIESFAEDFPGALDCLGPLVGYQQKNSFFE